MAEQAQKPNKQLNELLVHLDTMNSKSKARSKSLVLAIMGASMTLFAGFLIAYQHSDGAIATLVAAAAVFIAALRK
jgi:hypothetical protein